MDELEIVGKSVDEAVFRGITQMGLSLDEVSIDIIEESSGFLGMGKKVKVRLVKKTEKDILADKAVQEEKPKEEKEYRAKREPRRRENFRSERPDRRDNRREDRREKEDREPYVSDMVETDGPKEATIKEFLSELIKHMNVEATVHCQKLEDGTIKVEMRGDSKQIGALIGYRGDVLDALQHLTSLAVNKDEDTYNRLILDVEGYRHKREQTLVTLAKRMAQKAQRKGKVVMEPMNPYERRILHATLQDDDSVTTYSEGEDPMRRVIIVSKNYEK